MATEVEKIYAVKNTTHGCGTFETPQAAVDQIKKCREVPDDLRFFHVGKGCQVCRLEDLPDPERIDVRTCPFGTLDGRVDYTIRVIYLPDAQK